MKFIHSLFSVMYLFLRYIALDILSLLILYRSYHTLSAQFSILLSILASLFSLQEKIKKETVKIIIIFIFSVAKISANYKLCKILKKWRRERDSNPRNGFPFTRFPSVRLQPSFLELLIRGLYFFTILKKLSC